MNFDLLSLIFFYALLYLFYLRHKDKFVVQGKLLFMYRTKLGIRLMDSFANKYPCIVKILGFLGVVAGFAGMGFIFVFLIKETISFLITPGAIAPLAPVLPGVKIPGIPVLSFWHWVVSILIVASIHEFSHGLLSRLHKVKIKSSGFAFLGPMLMAFVEPDEKQLKKVSPYKQLSIFAAGPFSNILTGVVFLGLLTFVLLPSYSSIYEIGGVNVTNISAGYPLAESGLEAPFVISEINGVALDSVGILVNLTDDISPGDKVALKTSKGDIEVIAVNNSANETKGVIGINQFDFIAKVKDEKQWIEPFIPAIKWLDMLVAWLFMISIGVALFNLLPLGPVDGGRMFFVAMLWIFKKEKTAKMVWNVFSGICLLLIFVNLLPWIIKLFAYVISGVSWVIGLL